MVAGPGGKGFEVGAVGERSGRALVGEQGELAGSEGMPIARLRRSKLEEGLCVLNSSTKVIVWAGFARGSTGGFCCFWGRAEGGRLVRRHGGGGRLIGSSRLPAASKAPWEQHGSMIERPAEQCEIAKIGQANQAPRRRCGSPECHLSKPSLTSG